MEIMSNLLSPLIEATNALQANHVTSSLAIPVLTGAYKGEHILNGGQTSAVLATKMLEEKYQMEKGKLKTAVAQTVETVEENPATKSKSLLHHIREEKRKQSVQQSQ
ncbi:unnamed protein product, partial [Allacma fusca]